MEKLQRQPDVRRHDYNAFVNEIKLFHQNKGTPFRHLPRINGREIDLFKLYNEVTTLGGLQKVNEHQKWIDVGEALELPKACANACLALRQIYIRYLGQYEKIHFIGEDVEEERNLSSESHSRKQLAFTLLHPVPMFYNHLQHQVTDSQRASSGLSQNFITRTDYDKLCLSFLSGLPNEQELALNVSTILSNEGNYMLHLENAPKLVNFLIAQAGVWPAGDLSLKDVCLDGWKGVNGHDMRKFWKSTLNFQNRKLLELCDFSMGENGAEDLMMNLGINIGSLSMEGQRVLRVALILHNLSFEKNNVPVLVSNSNFLRFMLLCMHSSWGDLKQTAYDTLANLASEVQLSIEKDLTLCLLFQTIMDGICSSDRFLLIRSLDILSQLCLCAPNEDIIPSRLDVEIYHQMVSYLTIHDIMLLFFTLEALYALSDLGRYACEKIVSVHRSIGALVSLLTLEPSQYGSSSLVGMKIVETLVPAVLENEESLNCSKVSDQLSSKASTSASGAVLQDDSNSLVCRWLKSNYELASGCSVSRNELYADYVGYCSKLGKKGVVNASIFASCVKHVFSQSGLKKVESRNGTISFHHDGLQKKKLQTTHASPSKVVNECTTPVKKGGGTSLMMTGSSRTNQKLSNSPILKAHLSAPPRPGISPSVKRSIQPLSVIRKTSPSCFVPSKSPAILSNSQNSTLIKSLLASKVQQRNLQRQLHVQPNLRKMVIYSPEKSGCLGRNLGATQTVMRAVRPGASVTQPCGAPQFSRTSVQSNVSSNKSRVVTSRLLKANPLLVPKIETNPLKEAVRSNVSTISCLNGIIHDTQLDICLQEERKCQVNNCLPVHVLPQQNHLVKDKLFVDSNDSICSDADSFKESCLSSDSEKNSVLSLDDASSGFQASTVSDTAELDSLVSSQSNSKFISDSPSKEIRNENTSVHNISAVSSVPQSIENSCSSSSSSLLESVLCNLESSSEDSMLAQVDKEKICKRAPLLNGLLDKGKMPSATEAFATVQNGNETNSVVSEDSSEQSTVKSENFNMNAMSPFAENGDSLMQLCSGQTTLSGTIEVQPDQKGVVRLHIESPENSNHGSDLSSISDIARTLECASKAISKTNAECSSHLPFTCSCETTATVTVITTNTPTLARPGQQIIVVTPALNHPQLHIQSPNIKFRILHSIPKMEETASADLIGFPRVSINQLNQAKQSTIDTSASICAKRPSSDCSNSLSSPEIKKPRMVTKTPLLEATLKLPTPVPSSVSSNSANSKLLLDNHTLLSKSSAQIDTLSPSKLSIAKAVAVPLQNIDYPNEKEAKTFSGLSSAGDHVSVLSSPNIPTKSISSISKLEYICEWKNCGKKFSSAGAVLVHAGKVHAPYCSDDMLCQWEGCDSMKRRRFSLLTHLQDWHCNERVLHAQAMRRKQLNQQGKTTVAAPQTPPPHPGYAPDAAILAIRRHALQYLNPKELSEEKESALTKSIRLTSALILRNLVTHSSLARSYLRCYETELAYLAMSPVESSRTIAQCLSELCRSHD